jgi:hypothetical protein
MVELLGGSEHVGAAGEGTTARNDGLKTNDKESEQGSSSYIDSDSKIIVGKQTWNVRGISSSIILLKSIYTST